MNKKNQNTGDMQPVLNGWLQEKMLKYNLKATDAFYLRWFYDFATDPKNKNYTIGTDGKKYYFVNYKDLMTSFPCFKITSCRTISAAFDKYIELGLVKKILNKDVLIYYEKGTLVQFAITDKLVKMDSKGAKS